MTKMYKTTISILFILVWSILGCSQKTAVKETTDLNMSDNNKYEIATLGAGCFWCVEAVFQELKGVVKVESGYTGGHVKNPTYEQICTKLTGHAEVAQVHFDPEIISFEEILEVFWSTHNPTTPDQQGNDKGPQYRSAIYYHDDAQRLIAEKSKIEVAPQLWDDPIVTEITELGPYYGAEAYHQDFYTNNPNYGYCRAVINPKMAKFRKRFADKLK